MNNEKTVTIMAKVYPGTGRPDSFELVDDGDTERIELLEAAYGYYVIDSGRPPCTDPWDKYTYVDNDGFAQWK